MAKKMSENKYKRYVKWKNSKRLKMFSDFDEQGFHPTLEFRLVKDGGEAVIGAVQLWRHKDTDEPEWREVPFLELGSENSSGKD